MSRIAITEHIQHVFLLVLLRSSFLELFPACLSRACFSPLLLSFDPSLLLFFLVVCHVLSIVLYSAVLALLPVLYFACICFCLGGFSCVDVPPAFFHLLNCVLVNPSLFAALSRIPSIFPWYSSTFLAQWISLSLLSISFVLVIWSAFVLFR